MKYIIPFILISTIFSCTTEKKSKATYFGGKIINPKSDFVVFRTHNKVIDTIKLNPDNTFLNKLENIKEGLYYFKHGLEHQFVYLEPNDSLLIRLNTWDFDESLVFSGSNADKNNILINSFLESEKTEKLFYNFCKLPPKKFKIKVDSLKKINLNRIENFKEDNPNTSQKFLEILRFASIYPLYNQLENYSINHKQKVVSDSLPEIPKSFLEYRKGVNMRIDSIMFFTPYSDLVVSKIYNDVYDKGFKKDTDEFTVALLNTIDKNIGSEDLKNTYLRHATIQYFYKKSSCNINKNAFYTFFKLNTSIEDKKDIQRLLNDAKKLKKGENLPHFKLVNSNKTTKNIHNLIKDKNTFLYFKDNKFSSEEYLTSRINFLIKKNPNVNFLIINLNNNKGHSIPNIDIKNQYYIEKGSSAHQFLTSKFPRAILINRKGVIQNGFGSLSSEKIVTQLQNLQK